MVVIKVFVLLLSVGLALSECPSAEVARPCQCRKLEQQVADSIVCVEVNTTAIQQTLKQISNSVKNKRFQTLYVKQQKANKWTDIPANFTDILLFDDIVFDTNDSLCQKQFPNIRIHRDAFKVTARQINFFSFDCFNISIGPPPHNIFNLVNSFVNAEKILLAGVAHIPTGAVKLPKLKTLALIGPMKPFILPLRNRQMIGADAFKELKNISELQLGIDFLPANALRLDKSKTPLSALVIGPSMNESSLAPNSLSQFNRPTNLQIGAPIKFLRQEVFKPFLDADAKNSLRLPEVQLNCSDCRNAWVAKQQAKYKSRVLEAKCDGKKLGPSIFDKKFDHCK